MSGAALEIADLAVEAVRAGVRVVDGVSVSVGRGEAVGLVGESGSGKTITAKSALRILGPGLEIVGGRIRIAGTEMLGVSERDARRLRGAKIAMIFQDPMAALNPVLRIGHQIGEMLPRRFRAAKVLELLGRVHIAAPEVVADAYPHQLSGGMRQRALIAMALAREPEVLLADEPTTALDVTVQAGILDLFTEVRRTHGTAILFITHDLAVVARVCERIVVMQGGRVVETGMTHEILTAPQHPYTQALLRAALWTGGHA